MFLGFPLWFLAWIYIIIGFLVACALLWGGMRSDPQGESLPPPLRGAMLDIEAIFWPLVLILITIKRLK